MEGYSQSRQYLGGDETLVVNVFYKVANGVVYVRGAKGWESTTIPLEIYSSRTQPIKEGAHDL